MARLNWGRDGVDWPNRATSRFVKAGGMTWHVQQMGQGPVLLLIHGTGVATHSWRDLMPLLAQHFTVIAPDLPGHGFSGSPPRNGMSLNGMAHLIGSLMTVLEITPAITAGHSAGAAIAARAVLDGTIETDALVSLNGALLPFPGVAARLFPAMAQALFANPFVPKLFAMQARIMGDAGSFLARSTGSKIDADGVKFYTRLLHSSDHCAAALAMMANWKLEPLKADLHRLTLPMMLIHGKKDAAIPASVSAQVAAIVPHATHHAFPSLGHLAHEEDPVAVANALIVFARDHAILPKIPEREGA